MKTQIFLQDLLQINGIDPKDVLLIRHSLAYSDFRECYEIFLHEYTQIQPVKAKALSEHKYWMVFVSSGKTHALFHAMYAYKGKQPLSEHKRIPDFPRQEMYDEENNAVYLLEETDLFSDMKKRLTIDWGKGAINWYNKGIHKKPIVSIQTASFKRFPGYDKLLMPHDELAAMVNDITGEYQEYKTALSAIKGVYLILNTATGEQYIGSASGDDGILGRWMAYANLPFHGDNKKLIELLASDRNAYKNFQFSLLQIFSKTATDKEILETEELFKKKLGSRVFGLNAN